MTLNPQQQEIADLFDKHVQAELDADLDRTMATMTDAPHLINVPNGMGGFGQQGVRDFYASHLVGKFFPPDVEFALISRTIADGRLVDEMVISFTHTMVVEWMLPGISPTGRRVEVPFVVIVGVEAGKVSYEHIYWDQASALVQIGLLDPVGLPVCGAEGARLLADAQGPQRTNPSITPDPTRSQRD